MKQLFAKEKRSSALFLAIALVLSGAVALACAFRCIPVLSHVSGGFVIIICAVTAAALGAVFAPIPEDDGEEAESA